MSKKLLVYMISAIFIGLFYNQQVQAADMDTPEVINSQISSNTIAYQGNGVPGYVTVTIETNEPTRGYLMAVGNGRQVKINLSTMEYKTKHIVHWAPWDDVKKEALPAGTYQLKSYLTDQAYNSAQGFPIGQITIVQEPNPKSLITLNGTNPSSVSPKYNSTDAVTEVKYELSRHAEVQVAIQKDGTDVYQSPKTKLEPGIHSFTWNGRNQNGAIVADGDYDIVFKTIELNYNYPATSQTNYKLGEISVVNGESSIPKWRMQEIVSNASFDAQTLSPNNDGMEDTVTGEVTLNEAAKLTVFIATAAGSHMNHVISYQELQPGIHTLSWNGTDMNGGKALNGNYFIKVMVTENNGTTGYLLFENNGVMVKDSTEIKAAEPIKEVRVTAEKTQVSVYPMGQGYTAVKGEVFKLISETAENGYYEVLVKDQVPGSVKASDVELVLNSIPPQQEEPGNVVKHTVVSGDTLWKIAQKYSVTISEIVELNGLDLNQLLNIGQVLKIPEKQLTEPSTNIVHTVQSSDTLWKIAQKYNVSVDSIVKANNLNVTQYLYIGQKLIIPASQPSQPPVVTQPDTIHVVQSGDTLWKIAQKYGITIQEIFQANKLNENDYLYIGQKLTIPAKQTSPAPLVPEVIHTVQTGDTLWKISVKYNTTIQKVVDHNQLDVNKPIMIGQQLKIPV
ncbi:LysM peptidoglycan-binding domain-containing protein [Bacillus sp. V3B]|uniref:LysM peptidoglycan-binding domain-containing protein n=1 Tax=Bacillus sp. V3B TaxID=2804915 RepID=UPI00210C4D70|nr:LysM peptidoglycan-binding domain-containing protein [Bacillus sp. V3B]MCQ6277551.1 LysM peptidoglycan-binding domain-containing protein [Bacillus sp. V3B]